MNIKPQSSEDLQLMEKILYLKLENHPNLKEELLKTEDALIIEDVTKRPYGSGLFWGAQLVTPTDKDIQSVVASWWRGSNNLGHLWMKIRSALQEK